MAEFNDRRVKKPKLSKATANPIPWEQRATPEELHSEHRMMYGFLVDSHQHYGVPHDYQWPRYEGHGSTTMAHEGIVARGHMEQVAGLEAAMKSRKIPLPKNNLSTFPKDAVDPAYPVSDFVHRARQKRLQRGK